jgi:SAM-dependent methyltransferase
MKYHLLDSLACPSCDATELALESYRVDREASPPEVVDGLLVCSSCRSHYPVVDSIPRFLPDSWEEHRGRLSVYRSGDEGCAAGSADDIATFRKFHKATQQSFGFEWLRYRVTSFSENQEFFRRSTGLSSAELRGKRVLDAGCGMGRFMEVAASEGAEVVGLDLSLAVERAWRETKHRSQVHVVQGDILRPPFRKDAFDAVYSIGVLHHTPDTRQAFRALHGLLRAGGRISIWVYPAFQPEEVTHAHKRAFARFDRWLSDAARHVTTRLPHEVLHYLCLSAGPLGWLKRQVSQNAALKYLGCPVLLLPISSHAEWQVRVCDTFDWLSPRYQWKHTTPEVVGWFEHEGLTEILPLPEPTSVRGMRRAARLEDRPLGARVTETDLQPSAG